MSIPFTYYYAEIVKIPTLLTYLILTIMKGIKNIPFKTLLNCNKYGLYLHEYQAYDLLKKYKLPLVPVNLL